MRLIITGSEYIKDYFWLEGFLLDNYRLEAIEEILTCGDRGVDSLANGFAKKFKIKNTIFLAYWDKLGKFAGPIRNSYITKFGDELLAILDLDHEYKGIEYIINAMLEKGKPVLVTTYMRRFDSAS